jgi:uncharacterized protein YwbE
MDHTYLKKIFDCDEDFIGSLSTESGFIVKDLHFKLKYSLVNESKIIGEILGNADTCEKLHFLMKEPHWVVAIESDNEYRKVNSNSVLLSELRFSGTSTMENPMKVFKIATLNPHDLLISCKGQNNSKRTITFFLTGPDIIKTLFSEKYVKNKNGRWYPKKKYLGKFENFKAYVTRSKLKRYFDNSTEAIIHKRVCIQFECDLSEKQLSDKTFIKESKKITDILLILASFVTNRWVNWHGYSFRSEAQEQEYYKNFVKKSEQSSDIEDLIVTSGNFEKFFRKAYKTLLKYQENNFDLIRPIRYLIYGNDAQHTEAKFTTTFLALEQLKDAYANKEGMHKNLKDKYFKELNRKIKELIRSEIENPEKIIDKTPELNRPSIKHLIEQMLIKYKVEWKDLYPGSKLTFFNIRNQLTHSSQHPHGETVLREFLALQLLLSRILIKILDCDNFSNREKLYSLKSYTVTDMMASDL